MQDNRIVPETINWKPELIRTADRLHVIACWTAIILNPLFVINDLATIPSHWKSFLIVRVIVILITALFLMLRIKKKISTETMIFIPFLAISFQNAYMYSVMDVATFQMHTFAYLALFIGAGMLILWEIKFTIAIVILSLIANAVLLSAFSQLTWREILGNGGFLTATVMIFTVLLVQNRYSLTKKEIIARLALELSNRHLAKQKKIIEEKNNDILDSIRYAKRIQEAILPPLQVIKDNTPLTDLFVLYKPKDIVSGDFYWFNEHNNSLLITAADCTGHGVPGAFMSMLCTALLNDGVNEKGFTRPAELLDYVRKGVIHALKQSGREGEQKDGMDCALISLTPLHYSKADGETTAMELACACAHNPVWIIRGNNAVAEISEINADRQPVAISEKQKPFTAHVTEVYRGDTVYLITDGFKDQFGGDGGRGKKFKTKRLKELLISLVGLPMEEQKKILERKFDEWKGNGEQTDDVTVIGIRI